MKPVLAHIPGKPKTDAPPDKLLQLLDAFQPELPVVRWGLTTTTEGDWGLYVTVPSETEIPLPHLALLFDGYPIVYEAEPEEPITLRS